MTNIVQVHSELELARTCPSSEREAGRSTVLVASCVGCCLVFVSGSVISVALAAIGRDLAIGSRELQWVINSELLPLAAFTPLGGALGDRYGSRRIFLVGIAIFGFASLACAMSVDWVQLVCARLLQGVGEATILPGGLTILGNAFPPDRKSTAVGIWSASAAVAAAVAPALAGLILDHGSWRWVFLIQAPAALIAFALAWIWAPKKHPDDRVSIDLAAAGLSMAGLGILGWSLIAYSNDEGWSLLPLVGLLTSLTLFILLAVVERRKGDRAMLPPALFMARTVVSLNIFTLALYGATAATSTLIPFVMIKGAHLSPLLAGLAFVPLQILIVVVSPMASILCARFGRKVPLAAGAVIASLGCVAATRIGVDAQYWKDVFPAVFLVAVGLSLALAPMTTLVLTSVDEQHAATASGFNSAVSRAAQLSAVALLGGIFELSGSELVERFHVAMFAAAAACLVAGAAAASIAPNEPLDLMAAS